MHVLLSEFPRRKYVASRQPKEAEIDISGIKKTNKQQPSTFVLIKLYFLLSNCKRLNISIFGNVKMWQK